MDQEQFSSIGGASAGREAPRGYNPVAPNEKPTPLDNVRREAERASVRATEIRRRLLGIGERIVGPAPQSAERQTGDAISQSGFIPGTSSAIERLHAELTTIEDLLAAFEQTI